MVTLNINIGGDGKDISSSALTTANAQSQQILPTPFSAEKSGEQIPSPEQAEITTDSSKSIYSVPHPMDFEASISSHYEPLPTPDFGQAESAQLDSNIPTPMDFEAIDTASSSSKPKPKPRATRGKTVKK